jgi:hypothetical protein
MVLCIEGKQLRFGSYYGAKVKVLKQIDNGYKVIIKQGKYLICIKVYMGDSFHLLSPIQGEMNMVVQETLEAFGILHIYKDNCLLIKDRFVKAGCEVQGY